MLFRSVYYYFKNKEDLFINSIEKCYINGFDIFYEGMDSEISIEELIEKFVVYYTDLYRKLQSYYNNDQVYLKLYSLINYSATNFPDISERLKSIRIRKYKLWQRAVEVSYSKGEIKDNIDIAQITSLFFGISYQTFKENEEIVEDIEALDGYRKSCLLIYDLIKSKV